MSQRQPNFLDTLAGLIPGYTGYAERETRRSQDKRLRDHVAQELDRSNRFLDSLIGLVLERGDLEGLDQVDSLKRVVGTCADSLRNASYGESGLMDDIVVKTADLERVLQNDHGLHAQAEELSVAISALTSATYLSGLPDVRQMAKGLEKAIQQREDLLREVFH